MTPSAPQPTPLERGDRAYESGSLEAAAQAYGEHIADSGDSAADRALFRRGLVLYGSGSATERLEGRGLLERLGSRRPSSEYRLAAESLLRLQRRIDRLEKDLAEVERQLEVLKRIDLERARKPVPEGG